MKIYLLSALGTDGRVFDNYNFKGHPVIPIDYIEPEKNESIDSYVEKLADQIDMFQPAILIGVSFGGILALALSKRVRAEQVLLISTVKSRKELPRCARILGGLKIMRLFPPAFFTRYNRVVKYFFGIEGNEDAAVLKQFLKDASPEMVKWGINRILELPPSFNSNANSDDAENISENTIHIHGVEDRIFSIKKIDDCHEIEGGGHFMIWNNYPEIQIVFDLYL
ncbi:MAG: alpha/beta hydrolase [Leptospirales bacterium]